MGLEKKKFLGSYLMLKKEYAEMILSNKKTSTIRLGYVIPKKREVIVHSGGRPIAKILIEEVIHKRLYELSEEDAKREGYRDLSELIRELRKIYGEKLRRESMITIIRFRVVERLDSLDVSKPYLGLDPVDIAKLSLKYIDKELSEEERRVLEFLRELKSIRAVALKIYGDINSRYLIRKILKKSLSLLINKRIISVKR
ncbi:MAG: ASCH domain-containing protein [Sulfolobales archaeon]